MAPPDQTLSWTQYGGGQDRTNAVKCTLEPPLRLAWKSKTRDYLFDSPLVFAGNVFAGSRDGSYRCWSLEDGKELWEHKLDPSKEVSEGFTRDNYPENDGACVVQDTVIVADDLGFLHGLSRKNGFQKWCTRIGTLSHPQPLVIGDRVIVGASSLMQDSRTIQLIDVNNGETIWRANTRGQCFSMASSGNVVVAVQIVKHGGFVSAFDAERGTVIWERAFPVRIASGVLIQQDSAMVGSPEGGIHALSVADGEVVWTIPEQRMWGAPALAAGRLYIPASRLYAYDLESLKLLWEAASPGMYRGGPVVAGNYVYIGGGDHRGVYAHSVETGEIVWSHETGDMVFSTPAIVDNRLVIGSHDGYLYCFEGATG